MVLFRPFGSGEHSSAGKCLSSKHQDLSWNPECKGTGSQNVKKLGAVAHTCHSSTGGVERGRSLGLTGLVIDPQVPDRDCISEEHPPPRPRERCAREDRRNVRAGEGE